VTEILASLFITAFHPFSNINVFIKILSSFVKDAMFVNINYVTDDPSHLQRNLTTALKITGQFLTSLF